MKGVLNNRGIDRSPKKRRFFSVRAGRVSPWTFILALTVFGLAACGEPEPTIAPTSAPAPTVIARPTPTRVTALVPTVTILSPSPVPAIATPTRSVDVPIEAEAQGSAEVLPFTNVAPRVLGESAFVSNLYPGVAIFDYDRDGDLDFYVTQAESGAIVDLARGGPNRLFRNNGDGTYTEVAEEAGVAAAVSNSDVVAACDFDNDGYQDLYVGAYGRMGDRMDYRALAIMQGLRDVVKDRLFLNNRDGTFTEITESAFGVQVNIRSTAAVACSDVDGDGWLDIYIGNRADEDFVRFDRPEHHGHYNVLFRNNGDLTFTDVTEEAGVAGRQIVMRDPDGVPYTWQDSFTGKTYEGYNPELRDAASNRVGDPTGQTWAVLFFDYDDDGDQDLWLADDGDRLKVYRNDSSPGRVRFTYVARAMGVDKAGGWMGFAVGDFDGDADLDIFVTNLGFHGLTRLPPFPGGDCAYGHRFNWGTCFHFLLRNDGVAMTTGFGAIGRFVDVAASTQVQPSRVMPPASLDPSNIDPAWQLPTGLAAYDFGFGAAFFDLDNDTDQDLYWLGSVMARGEGPRGMFYPSAGRMLRGNGRGAFEDITVEAHLLDIQDVDYSILDPADPDFDARRQRIGVQFHENGKGLAKCDLDGDGYVDLIGTNSSGEVFRGSPDEVAAVQGPVFVWMNGGEGNHWITLRLTGRMAIDGTGSNADGIGARVYVRTSGADGAAVTQVQELTASGTFLSMNCLELSFGLGAANKVREIEVRWPSGVTQTLTDVDADQVLAILESKP